MVIIEKLLKVPRKVCLLKFEDNKHLFDFNMFWYNDYYWIDSFFVDDCLNDRDIQKALLSFNNCFIVDMKYFKKHYHFSEFYKVVFGEYKDCIIKKEHCKTLYK